MLLNQYRGSQTPTSDVRDAKLSEAIKIIKNTPPTSHLSKMQLNPMYEEPKKER